ncbi:MAG: DUF6473 family protein [Pseudomonadota bacterium]
MANMGLGRALLELQPCRYGYSQIDFRGPEVDRTAPYIAFLGATETVGPFLTRPFPTLTARLCDLGCANLGIKNAGPDAFLRDPEVLAVARGAEAVVLEVMGAVNLSNAFYKVHPRRNDRFVRAYEPLREIAPRLDLTDVHFTGHLMVQIAAQAPQALRTVQQELQSVWVERMQALIDTLGVPVHLLRLPPPASANIGAFLIEPLMMAAIATEAASITRARPSEAAHAEGTKEMFFSETEAPVAAHLLSAMAHEEIAEALAANIRGDTKKRARAGYGTGP